MEVKRGRPPKKKKEEVVEVNENVSKETEEKVDKEDTTMDEIKEFMQPSEPSDNIFNPLKEDVVKVSLKIWMSLFSNNKHIKI